MDITNGLKNQASPRGKLYKLDVDTAAIFISLSVILN